MSKRNDRKESEKQQERGEGRNVEEKRGKEYLKMKRTGS